jgi:hypothetical protein
MRAEEAHLLAAHPLASALFTAINNGSDTSPSAGCPHEITVARSICNEDGGSPRSQRITATRQRARSIRSVIGGWPEQGFVPATVGTCRCTPIPNGLGSGRTMLTFVAVPLRPEPGCGLFESVISSKIRHGWLEPSISHTQHFVVLFEKVDFNISVELSNIPPE